MPEFEESQAPRPRSAPETYRPGRDRRGSRGSGHSSPKRSSSSKTPSSRRHSKPKSSSQVPSESFFGMLFGFFRALFGGGKTSRRKPQAQKPQSRSRKSASSRSRGPEQSDRQSKGPNADHRPQKPHHSRKRSSGRKSHKPKGGPRENAAALRPAVEDPVEKPTVEMEEASPRFQRPSTKSTAKNTRAEPDKNRTEKARPAQAESRSDSGSGSPKHSSRSRSRSGRKRSSRSSSTPAKPTRTPSPIVDVMTQREEPVTNDLSSRYTRRSLRDAKAARQQKGSNEKPSGDASSSGPS